MKKRQKLELTWIGKDNQPNLEPRILIDGERKGKSLIEILTRKVQEKDWVELLFDVVKEKDPDFFASIS